jgi:3D (Asp-Asp-Asp) domain-containing protein
VVEDTGSAIVGRRLDIYFESHEEALLFGIRFLPLAKC